MALTSELESLIEDRREAVQAAYLDAVARTAAGEELDPAETLAALEAVGVTPAAFAADVERQQRRLEAATIIAGKADWQTALADAETDQTELARMHSGELSELTTRHHAEMKGVRVRIDAAEQSLAEVKAAEKFLDETEGVSAIDPHPHRPMYGVVIAAHEDRGFLTIESDQTPTRGNELYSRYGQLPGISISASLVGRRLELAWFDGATGRKLRAVRVAG
jgi:hypothetical protein